MRRKPLYLATIAAVVGLATVTPVAAQNTEAESTASELDEITVTATKREAGIYDVPLAISAFTEQTMRNAGITDLVDIGKFVPNLNVTEFSAGHTASVNLIRLVADHLITTDLARRSRGGIGSAGRQNGSLSNIDASSCCAAAGHALRRKLSRAITSYAPARRRTGRDVALEAARVPPERDFYSTCGSTTVCAVGQRRLTSSQASPVPAHRNPRKEWVRCRCAARPHSKNAGRDFSLLRWPDQRGDTARVLPDADDAANGGVY